jgi:hypothetical protein
MDKGLKRRLVESISQANDLHSLQASLLALLGVAVADEGMNDEAAPPGGEVVDTVADTVVAGGRHGGGRQVADTMVADNSVTIAVAAGPVREGGQAASKKRKVVPARSHFLAAPKVSISAANRKREAAKAHAPAAAPGTAPGRLTAPQFRKTEAAKAQPAAASRKSEAPCAQTEAPGPSTEPVFSMAVGDAFETVVNGRNAKKAEKAEAARMPKPKPLVLEGVADDIKANPLAINKLLEEHIDVIARTATTKGGTVLIFPKTDAGRSLLMIAELTDGLSMRATKASQATQKVTNFVIVGGLHPSMTDDEISQSLGRPCKRMKSAKLGGAATWKVKVQCADSAEKSEMMKSGVVVGRRQYKVADFKPPQGVLQCYHCQGFGHIASACKVQEKCRKCGESHSEKDCKADNAVCANCKGNHSASDFACPVMANEKTKKETSYLSYANTVKKGGDQVDCIRLACSLATSITAILTKRAGLKVNASDICKDVADSVAMFYKVNVQGAHVHDLAYVSAKRTTV